MTILLNKYFNPLWRDDYFNAQALDTILTFPDIGVPTYLKDDIWIHKKYINKESIFKTMHQYDVSYERVAILKPSEEAQHYRFMHEPKDKSTPPSPAMLMGLFPPKAWITDNGEERCMMFAAAQLAQGHVLVAGLGLAIYPQFIFALQRPVKSITIIENNPKVIELVAKPWLAQHNCPSEHIHIIEADIEMYLQQTEQLFDTIYLDTWEDTDPRFLANINHLLHLASQRCSTEGQIQCWGYAKMQDTFVEYAQTLTKQFFPFDEYHLDPVLERYVQWLKVQNQSVLSEGMIDQAARKIALTVQKPLSDYNRERCFSPFAASQEDLHQNMALARKI